MKKLLCVLLALVMVMSLCACSQENPSGNNNANNQTNQNDENNQVNNEQNHGEPSADELKMMKNYQKIISALDNYVTNKSIAYDNGTEWVHGVEALQTIYTELSDMEELDKWYGSQWMPKDDPETQWDRQKLLSGFSVVEDKLLKQNCVILDRVGETEEYEDCFTWGYNADGTVDTVRWTEKIFNNFIPYVFGLENEAFYDVVQRQGYETEGADYIYDDQGTLTQIKILGYVDDNGDNYDNGSVTTQILFTLKYDASNKLVGADWAKKYDGYFGNIEFTYNAEGKLSQAVSAYGAEGSNGQYIEYTCYYSYSYDAENNVKEIGHKIEGPGVQKKDITTYTFTKNSKTETTGIVSTYGGAWREETKQNNRDVSLVYDDQGRLVKVTHGEGDIFNDTSWGSAPYNKAEFQYVYGDVYAYTPVN